MSTYQFLSIIGVQALSAFIINFLLNKFVVAKLKNPKKMDRLKTLSCAS